MHGIPSATLATSSGSSMANVSSHVPGRSATSGITGKPLEEARNELWHSREMQARLARLARPMIDLLAQRSTRTDRCTGTDDLSPEP